MHYKLDTTTSFQEKYEFRLYELDHTPHGKQTMKKYRLRMLFCLVGALMIGYGLYPYIWEFLAFSIFLLIGEGVWQLLAKTIMRRRLRRQVLQEEKFFGPGSSEDLFYDDGFCAVTDDIKYDVQYRCVEKAVLYKNSSFFLITKRMVFTVPCRCLAGQATVQEFADFLRSRGIALETIE